jgi:hypothetical protein
MADEVARLLAEAERYEALARSCTRKDVADVFLQMAAKIRKQTDYLTNKRAT